MRNRFPIAALTLALPLAASPALAADPRVPIAPAGPDAPPVQYDPAVRPAETAAPARYEVVERRPRIRALDPYYPEVHRGQGLSGRGVVACVAAARGRLSDCRAISARPGDSAFGVAAKVLSRELIAGPGTPPGTKLTYAIRFTVDPNGDNYRVGLEPTPR